MSPSTQRYDYASQLLASKKFFNTSSSVLTEEDSNFRPEPGMFTAAQQVAHVAQTLDWFIDGVKNGTFDLNFEEHAKQLEAITSLASAREWLEKSFESSVQFVRSQTAEQLAAPLPPGPIMGGQPVSDVIWAMVEHTAHHRGALTVYSRALGKVPQMPYMG